MDNRSPTRIGETHRNLILPLLTKVKTPSLWDSIRKKWMVIGSNSPFLSSVKQAILEKEGLNVPKPQAEK